MTYTPNDIITPSMIAAAEKAWACGEAIRWLRARKALTWQGLADANPEWLLWAAGQIGPELPAELIDACAEANPLAALRYAAQYLTPERLDACAEAEPWAALRYASKYLTPERLDACAEADPETALACAAQYLTPESLDACAEAEPGPALTCAAQYLTPERLVACRKAIQ